MEAEVTAQDRNASSRSISFLVLVSDVTVITNWYKQSCLVCFGFFMKTNIKYKYITGLHKFIVV